MISEKIWQKHSFVQRYQASHHSSFLHGQWESVSISLLIAGSFFLPFNLIDFSLDYWFFFAYERLSVMACFIMLYIKRCIEIRSSVGYRVASLIQSYQYFLYIGSISKSAFLILKIFYIVVFWFSKCWSFFLYGN